MKKLILLVLFILIFAGLNAKQNALIAKSFVQNITENSAELIVDKMIQQEKITVLLSESEKIEEIKTQLKELQKNEISLNDAQKIDEAIIVLFNGKKPEKIKIKDLKAATKYHISIFSATDMKLIENLSFVTLAKEPEEQSENIIFKDIKKDSITLLFKPGNGEKRLIFVSKENKPSIPIDGKSYVSNPVFGEKNAYIDGSTYCVANGNEKHITVSGLEHAEYYFHVFDYNGNDESSNYLTISAPQNPRSKVMPLPPPVALSAIDFIEGGFSAKWEPVKGAVLYELIIASDIDFLNVIEPYNNMDVGDISEMEVIELEPGDYYYKVRAFGKKTKSDYSNIIKVELK